MNTGNFLKQSAVAYVVALGVVVVATIIRMLLSPILQDGSPFATYVLAVIIVAWFGGLRPALVAAVLGFFLATFLFVFPYNNEINSNAIGRFSMYFMICLTVAGFAEMARVAQSRSIQAEHNAKRQADTLRITFASFGDAVISTDMSETVTFINVVAQELTGWAGDSAVGKKLEVVYSILNERTRSPIDSPAKQVLEVGHTITHQDRMILVAKDGTELPIESTTAPIRGDQGEVNGIVLVFRDVTKFRQALDAKLRLAAIVESSDDAIISHDLNGTIVSWNGGAERLYGYRAEEMVGQSLTRLVPPESADEVPTLLERLRSGDRIDHYETIRVCKDGSRVDVSLTISPVRNADDQIIGAAKIARNISQHKRIHDATRFLADSSAELAMLVDYESTLQKVASLAVPDFADWVMIDLLEPDGTLRRVAVSHRDPVKVEAAVENNRRFPPDPDAEHGVWNIIRKGKSELISEVTDQHLESSVKNPEFLDIIRKTGIRSYIGVPLSVRGKMLGVLSFFIAKSGRRYDEHDLLIADQLAHRSAIAIENAMLYQNLKEADRRKDEFLAILAHELRNPLAPMRNSIEILRADDLDISKLEYARDVIDRQVQHMTRLIDDLLDVSRISRNRLELRRETVALKSVIDSAIEASRPIIEESEHDLRIVIPDEPIFVDADQTRLAQVFLNLLNNAAKYTERGGRIELRAIKKGSQVDVIVTDNGIGIPPDKVSSLFQMFSQVTDSLSRSQGGLGIGLSLVKRLVEMHGGSIEAFSEGANQGSTFTVRLPVVEASKPAAQPPQPSSNFKKSGKLRILVVDDNYDAAATVSMFLRMMGHEVEMAHDGEAALQEAIRLQPDVIVLDIGLPKMNGYDVARAIREQEWSRSTTLIAVTGWGQEDDRQKAVEAGFDKHMVKPADPQVLLSILAEVQSRNIKSPVAT